MLAAKGQVCCSRLHSCRAWYQDHAAVHVSLTALGRLTRSCSGCAAGASWGHACLSQVNAAMQLHEQKGSLG